MSDQEKKKDPFRETLQLPSTTFGMKANLAQMEPRIQARWTKMGLYDRIRAEAHPKGRFVLHDGPPYANGNIHVGHLLNKVLKDIMLRSLTMMGHDIEFVPGWDCHGQPIEYRVLKDLGERVKDMVPAQIRYRCKDYAEKFVKIQSREMQRLGTMGRYEDPYLTMNPQYEGATLEVFATLVEEGLVYRALKSVHWSIENKTALAEAELEYMDREDTSIYVFFPITEISRLPKSLKVPKGNLSLMIWTTTPWTLPANLAAAVSPEESYGLYSFTKDGQTSYTIIAEKLAEKVFKAGKAASFKLMGSCLGKELVSAKVIYKHPFIDRICPVVAADYVTMEDGTGIVHTAPGHGEEDYRTGLAEGLDIYCPVLADGTFDETAPDWLVGFDVWEANGKVLNHLQKHGFLFYHHKFNHSYPHDWRGKTPTIMRATEQWFVAVDKPLASTGKSLRQMALDITKDIDFIPTWGESRLKGMLESRPDWCISRQRNWGLPIPAFLSDDGKILLTPATVRAIAKTVRKHGADSWYKMEAKELLGDYNLQADIDAPEWLKKDPQKLSQLTKSSDIFDVWFESGSSWNAVLRERNIGYPSSIYLEGSDQHRGWFQLSLLPALAVTKTSPFKTLLTHGFIVDAEGKKMSKSLGNTIEVEDLIKKFGADVCRWWTFGISYTGDVRADMKMFEIASEEYRKVRNTLRFMLGNLNDFDIKKDEHVFTDKDKLSLDSWALYKLNELITETTLAYEKYQFSRVREMIFNFCNETLSAIYLAAIKDRLYCDKKDSPERRRTQTVVFRITDALTRLLAPVIVHTADEAWCALHKIDESNSDKAVHLTSMPSTYPVSIVAEDWVDVLKLRHASLRAMEHKKVELGFTNPLDIGIAAHVPDEMAQKLKPYLGEMADLCGISRFSIQSGEERFEVMDLRNEPRCERCWKRDGTVKERSNGHYLSDRDARVVGI